MKRIYLPVVALLFTGSLFLTSCKKGDQGPAGTANVIYSDWLDVTFEDVTEQGAEFKTWVAEISAPKLDNAILSTGEIKVFLNVNTAADPTVIEASTIGLTTVFRLNSINLIGASDLDDDDPYSTFTSQGQKSYQYRYVLIPGGVKATSSVNWNNYKEVQHATGMKN